MYSVQREGVGRIPGYLSLHQEADATISLKWTPNELMRSPPSSPGLTPESAEDSPSGGNNSHSRYKPYKLSETGGHHIEDESSASR